MAASPVSVGGGLVFDAGNIVSDAVFYNDAAMTDEQIAAFLVDAGRWLCRPVVSEESPGGRGGAAGGRVLRGATRLGLACPRPR